MEVKKATKEAREQERNGQGGQGQVNRGIYEPRTNKGACCL